jgi:hypothetical protein
MRGGDLWSRLAYVGLIGLPAAAAYVEHHQLLPLLLLLLLFAVSVSAVSAAAAAAAPLPRPIKNEGLGNAFMQLPLLSRRRRRQRWQQELESGGMEEERRKPSWLAASAVGTNKRNLFLRLCRETIKR